MSGGMGPTLPSTGVELGAWVAVMIFAMGAVAGQCLAVWLGFLLIKRALRWFALRRMVGPHVAAAVVAWEVRRDLKHGREESGSVHDGGQR